MATFDQRLNESWRWDTENFAEAIQAIYLPATPLAIHVVAYPCDTDNSDIENNSDDDRDAVSRPPGNHWAFFLQCPNLIGTATETAIRFDIQSGESSQYEGTVYLKHVGYSSTWSSVNTLTFAFTGAVTVQHIISYMMVEHLDCYRFTDHHEGCAYWTFCVIQRFAELGWLPTEATQETWNAIQYYYPAHGVSVSKYGPGFEGLIRGIFFVPDDA
ncbi:hypothetical protein BDZ89DRAFT_1156048 [Hymenopellis radicata]|nr:hypothetical protein BDZ89DRAFT_1156048 [Hymenopellis radicata]